MIPQRSLSIIANDISKTGGRRIPEAVIERDYVLAWFLTSLGQHPLREHLAFKGGTALRRCWFEDYRFSEDLDFTLVGDHSLDTILEGIREIGDTTRDACGLAIEVGRMDRATHLNCHTFYLNYKGPLPAPSDVKVDITVREHLHYPLVDRPILRTYTLFDDLPEGPTVRVYDVPEIIAEKVVALSDAARSEARDLYDLWRLVGEGQSLFDVRSAIEAKLDFREREVEGLYDAISGKEGRLRILWSRRLAHQMGALPGFDDVFREVKRALRAAGY